MATTNSWKPDVLGDHFEQLTIPLQPDDEGEVVATLASWLRRASAMVERRARRWLRGYVNAS